MSASPVRYIRDALLHGSLFEDDVTDGSISSIYTGFFVDHTEPDEVLHNVRQSTVWPFGELAEGCEFLLIVPNELRGRPKPLSANVS